MVLGIPRAWSPWLHWTQGRHKGRRPSYHLHRNPSPRKEQLMPGLEDHQSNDFVKMLLIGDAQAGKTGSLVSLVKAGYRLRILDFDNKLDVLSTTSNTNARI